MEQRLDGLFEVVAFLRVDLGRNLESPACLAGDGDGPVEPLLWRDAAEERQIILRPPPKGVQIPRKPMIDGRLPIGPGDRLSLIIGNGDKRHFGVLVKQGLQIRNVQSPV